MRVGFTGREDPYDCDLFLHGEVPSRDRWLAQGKAAPDCFPAALACWMKGLYGDITKWLPLLGPQLAFEHWTRSTRAPSSVLEATDGTEVALAARAAAFYRDHAPVLCRDIKCG